MIRLDKSSLNTSSLNDSNGYVLIILVVDLLDSVQQHIVRRIMIDNNTDLFNLDITDLHSFTKIRFLLISSSF